MEAGLIQERDPFHRALEALRGRVREGDFVQGEALTITDIARELRLSPTPVREALSRLAGEGLIEDRRGRGYFGWRFDPLDLVELYDLNQLHVGAALGVMEAATDIDAGPLVAREVAALLEAAPSAEGVAIGAEALFARIVRVGGGRALSACQSNLSDRLGPARKVEALVLAGADTELLALCERYDGRAWGALSEAVELYHMRRRAASGEIVAAARRRHGGAGW
ncbi:hypothetical protein AS593_06955 [Caulobacter vibrioides]|nr:hypothetical protein AS593_06955 [Caulobacter vibrioides]